MASIDIKFKASSYATLAIVIGVLCPIVGVILGLGIFGESELGIHDDFVKTWLWVSFGIVPSLAFSSGIVLSLKGLIQGCEKHGTITTLVLNSVLLSLSAAYVITDFVR